MVVQQVQQGQQGRRSGDARDHRAAGAPRSASGAQAEPIGRWLARQRELRGIDLHELSARTRIPHRSLERLEAGAFDGNPDGFVRGFVRTVALDLGLDPDDAVARMLSEPELERRRHRGPRFSFQAIAAALTLGLLFLAMAGATRWLFGVVSGATTPTRAVLRHDPVRALAAAERDITGPLPELGATRAAAEADGSEGAVYRATEAPGPVSAR